MWETAQSRRVVSHTSYPPFVGPCTAASARLIGDVGCPDEPYPSRPAVARCGTWRACLRSEAGSYLVAEAERRMSLYDGLKKFFRGYEPDVVDVLHSAEGESGRVLDALRTVNDPELGLDIVQLGLIRGIVVEEGRARIRLTMTSASCPMAGLIEDEVRACVQGLGLVPEVAVELDPPWDPSHIESNRAAEPAAR